MIFSLCFITCLFFVVISYMVCSIAVLKSGNKCRGVFIRTTSVALSIWKSDCYIYGQSLFFVSRGTGWVFLKSLISNIYY